MVIRIIYIPPKVETAGVARARSDTGLSRAAADDRRMDQRYACQYSARVSSSDRIISTACRIINISATGAKVEVMYPRRGPSTVFLLDQVNHEVYECEVRWRTDEFIGVRFLDVLGPSRRRRFFAGGAVPIKTTAHQIIQLDHPPRENVKPGPPPGRLPVSASPTLASETPAPPAPRPRD